jgi:hypothetical protein
VVAAGCKSPDPALAEVAKRKKVSRTNRRRYNMVDLFRNLVVIAQRSGRKDRGDLPIVPVTANLFAPPKVGNLMDKGRLESDISLVTQVFLRRATKKLLEHSNVPGR